MIMACFSTHRRRGTFGLLLTFRINTNVPVSLHACFRFDKYILYILSLINYTYFSTRSTQNVLCRDTVTLAVGIRECLDKFLSLLSILALAGFLLLSDYWMVTFSFVPLFDCFGSTESLVTMISLFNIM